MNTSPKFALCILACALAGNVHADSAYQWGPWMAQEDIERAILAGADPTELTDPTAAGETVVLPKIAVSTEVPLPRPSVEKVPNELNVTPVPTPTNGPVYGKVSWSSNANILLSMTMPGSGDVSVITQTVTLPGATATLGNEVVSDEGVRSRQISVTGPALPSAEYKFTVENQFDRPRSPATTTTLDLTGDGYKTGASYTDALKVGETASHSVTLDGSGKPVYSK